MRYAQIRQIDIANGEGIRVSLYVQGCHQHCLNCFNPETWDFCGGKEFDQQIADELIKLINRYDVADLLKRIKKECPDRTVWLYSAFLYEKIQEFDVLILPYIDVLVDGPYVDHLSDRKLRFRGSSNQRIIDVQTSLKQNKVVLYQPSRYYR